MKIKTAGELLTGVFVRFARAKSNCEKGKKNLWSGVGLSSREKSVRCDSVI